MPAGLSAALLAPGRLDALFAPVAGRGALGIAVSGGADSLALMVLAARWAEGRADGRGIFVYSVDHGLRPEAGAEVAQVLAMAGALGLAGRGLRWTGERPVSGVQAAARAARYRLIGAGMAADGAEVLLTAHHLRDQAETVLMRLAHGSGIEGLKGMAAFSRVEGVEVFRPLLGVEPEALAAVVEAAGLVPVLDPSNTDRRYERVRWRQLLPELGRLGLDAAALSRFARRMGEADAALAGMAGEAFARLVAFDGLGAARIGRAGFADLPRAVGVRVLGRALGFAGGAGRAAELGDVERLCDALAAGEALKTRTLCGCTVRADGQAIVLAREPGRSVPSDAVLGPGAELVWDGRFVLRNLSERESFSVGVGAPLARARAEALVGARILAPAEAIRMAPLVRDGAGTVLALGGYGFDPRVAVGLADHGPLTSM